MKIYITFGKDHHHIIKNISYDKDCVAVLEAESRLSGIDRVIEIFGLNYYSILVDTGIHNTSDKGIYPRGLIPVI